MWGGGGEGKEREKEAKITQHSPQQARACAVLNFGKGKERKAKHWRGRLTAVTRMKRGL